MKNNMKRIVSLVLALAFLFILAGCGNANTAKKIENDGSTILNSVVTVPVCFSEVQKQRILGAKNARKSIAFYPS